MARSDVELRNKLGPANIVCARAAQDRRIELVITLLEEDSSREFSLRRMAQLVNLSPTHFSYLFRLQTGMSPGRFLRSLRMHEAAVLLSTTFLSIKEVVARVGFSDDSHFVRDFKRTFGLAPTAYRRKKFDNRSVQIVAPNKNRRLAS